MQNRMEGFYYLRNSCGAFLFLHRATISHFLFQLHGHDAILIEVEHEVARRHLGGAESVDHGFTDHVRFLRRSEGDDGRAGAADGRSVGAGIHGIRNDLTGARDEI